MSRMVIRPPAARFHVEPQHGPSDLQNYAAVDQAKFYGSPAMGAQGGAPDFRFGATEIRYHIQDLLQINPAREQPRLDYTSGRQPFFRSLHNWRWSRTFMSASPRFGGRWAYVGYIQNAYAERARITGVATRRGTTYRYQTPRSIQTREIPL